MMSASSLFSFDEVKPLVSESFVIRDHAGGEVVAVLGEATSLGFNRPAAQGGRESFSLVFHVPAKVRVPQGTYDFTHPKLGSHALFLVPIGPDAAGMRLQTVFNFS